MLAKDTHGDDMRTLNLWLIVLTMALTGCAATATVTLQDGRTVETSRAQASFILSEEMRGQAKAAGLTGLATAIAACGADATCKVAVAMASANGSGGQGAAQIPVEATPFQQMVGAIGAIAPLAGVVANVITTKSNNETAQIAAQTQSAMLQGIVGSAVGATASTAQAAIAGNSAVAGSAIAGNSAVALGAINGATAIAGTVGTVFSDLAQTLGAYRPSIQVGAGGLYAGGDVSGSAVGGDANNGANAGNAGAIRQGSDDTSIQCSSAGTGATGNGAPGGNTASGGTAGPGAPSGASTITPSTVCRKN